jgi:hypothetical protein
MTLADAARGWTATRSALTQRGAEQQRVDKLLLSLKGLEEREALRREVTVLSALEAPLDALYNNALDEWFVKSEAERVELLAEFRQKGEAHNKRRPRRRYYCVPDVVVEGKLTCKLFLDKPDHENFVKVRAINRTEARAKWDAIGKAWSGKEVAA